MRIGEDNKVVTLARAPPVSYTHLDVYKRQAQRPAKRRVDPLKKTGGTEEEIDQILQDFTAE